MVPIIQENILNYKGTFKKFKASSQRENTRLYKKKLSSNHFYTIPRKQQDKILGFLEEDNVSLVYP